MTAPLVPLLVADVMVGSLVLYNDGSGFGSGLTMGFIVRQLTTAEKTRFAIAETAWQTVFPENQPIYGIAAFSRIMALVKPFYAADDTDLNVVVVNPLPDPFGV